MFKTESVTLSPTSELRHVNIGLGQAQALEEFNSKIISFQKIQ